MGDISDESRERRWPKIQPNAVRSAMVGLLALVVCISCYWYLVLGGRISILLSIAFILCTFLFTGLFTLLGESVIEDGIKAAIILILGCMFLHSFPASWCLAPGFSAIIATISNATVQSTIGRHF
jgi:hypothetical protein